MPVKDIEQKYYLPRLGKIHLGYKDPKGYPVRTEYFVCPPEIASYVGEKPKQLKIMIPVSDAELWRSEYYRYYTLSRGLVCKGTGETAIQMRDIKTGALPTEKSTEFGMFDIHCPGQSCPHYLAKRCRRVMNLQFLIPDIPGLGVWQIDTSSNTSINNIKAGELFVRAIYGKVYMIPLILELRPVEKTNLSDGKKHKLFAMYLNTAGTLSQLALAARQQVEQFQISLTGNGNEDEGEDADLLAQSTPEAVKKNIEELWPNDKPEFTTPSEPPVKQEPEPPADRKLKRDPTTVTQSNLLESLYKDYNLQPKEVLAELNVKTVREISDPAIAYLTIANVR